MDSSWKSPIEPPKDWVKKYYEKPPKGRFRRFFRWETILYMTPRTQYIIIGVCCFTFFWPIAIKPILEDARNMWKYPELTKNPFSMQSNLTPEMKEAVRKKNANIHSIYDLWK